MAVDGMWPAICQVVDAVDERSPDRTAVEAVVHHALALYATHQQSRDQPMHIRSERGQPPRSLGAACYLLRRAYERDHRSADGLERRFHAAATATSTTELAGHLRGLIPLLRGGAIPVDYVLLAQDLAGWRRPDPRARTRRRWGLDFYRAHHDRNSQDEPAEPTEET